MRGLFVGLTTIDLQFLIDSFPGANLKVKASHHEINIGRPATNAAIAFSYLGGDCKLLTGIGKNHFSALIKSEIDKYNIDYIDITPRYEKSPTFASIITSKNNGDRTVFTYNPKNEDIAFDTIKKIKITDYDIVLVDGFHSEAALLVAQKAKMANIPVVFDGGSWKNHSSKILDHVDIAICSNDFFPPGCSDKQDILNYLYKNKGINMVAITRGSDAIIYTHHGDNGKIDISDTKVIDTLGAGDIFHGAFAYYYSTYKSFEKSLRLASDIASESCRFFGTRAWMEHAPAK